MKIFFLNCWRPGEVPKLTPVKKFFWDPPENSRNTEHSELQNYWTFRTPPSPPNFVKYFFCHLSKFFDEIGTPQPDQWDIWWQNSELQGPPHSQISGSPGCTILNYRDRPLWTDTQSKNITFVIRVVIKAVDNLSRWTNLSLVSRVLPEIIGHNDVCQ